MACESYEGPLTSALEYGVKCFFTYIYIYINIVYSAESREREKGEERYGR